MPCQRMLILRPWKQHFVISLIIELLFSMLAMFMNMTQFFALITGMGIMAQINFIRYERVYYNYYKTMQGIMALLRITLALYLVFYDHSKFYSIGVLYAIYPVFLFEFGSTFVLQVYECGNVCNCGNITSR